MHVFSSVARGILVRSPAPAMTLAGFLAALERDHPEHRGDGARVLEALERLDGVRVLRQPPSAAAAELGPVAWILCYRRDRSRPMDPCLTTRRLRESVIALGEHAEVDALAAWARWSHLARQAATLCATLSRSRGAGRSEGSRWSDPRSPAVRTH